MTKSILKLCLLLLITSVPYDAISQSGEQNKSNEQTGGRFQSTFGGYYFLDAIGGMVQDRITPIEGAVDENYILGPNDVITVSIKATENFILRALFINSQGEIVIPQLGTINLDGLTISEATRTISQSAETVFKNSKTKITLDFAKQNVIHITGGVQFPGKYVVPPFTRIDQAIYPAVSNTPQADTRTSPVLKQSGLSIRNIIIRHKDGTTSNSDLYAYFNAGILDKNPLVRNGDQIIISSLSNKDPKIGISGAVQHALELEYLQSDTPEFLIELAGGFKPNADTSKLFIYRFQENTSEILEISRSDWGDAVLKPNDRIIVPVNKLSTTSASANVTGEVTLPGSFPIKDGETTALDLLHLSGGLTDHSLPTAAFLVRSGSIENEIPNKFNTDLIKRTSDQLQQGLQYLDTETRLSQNKVFIDLSDENQLSSVKIFDGDRLFIPRDEQTVFVFGQVNNPGYYPFSSNDISVSDYLERAGGFALSADRDRVFVIKVGSGTWYKPQETTLQSGDHIFVDRVPYDELNARRSYEVQKEQVKNTRIQLIMTGISTITGIITTYVAIQNIRN